MKTPFEPVTISLLGSSKKIAEFYGDLSLVNQLEQSTGL
jgi:hypothetical protein